MTRKTGSSHTKIFLICLPCSDRSYRNGIIEYIDRDENCTLTLASLSKADTLKILELVVWDCWMSILPGRLLNVGQLMFRRTVIVTVACVWLVREGIPKSYTRTNICNTVNMCKCEYAFNYDKILLCDWLRANRHNFIVLFKIYSISM